MISNFHIIQSNLDINVLEYPPFIYLQNATSFILKHSQKNHKFIFKEKIGTLITITNYNFEETFENVSLEQSKIVEGFLFLGCIRKMKKKT
jgi:hypothetical protein